LIDCHAFVNDKYTIIGCCEIFILPAAAASVYVQAHIQEICLFHCQACVLSDVAAKILFGLCGILTVVTSLKTSGKREY